MCGGDVCVLQSTRCDNACCKHTLTAVCISVVWACGSVHAVTVCFTAPLHAYPAIKSTHWHLEGWSSPASCPAPLCHSVFMLASASFRLCRAKSFLTGCLSQRICQAPPTPRYIPSASASSFPCCLFPLKSRNGFLEASFNSAIVFLSDIMVFPKNKAAWEAT